MKLRLNQGLEQVENCDVFIRTFRHKSIKRKCFRFCIKLKIISLSEHVISFIQSSDLLEAQVQMILTWIC